jgi:glutamine amidotransferase
MLVIIDYGVGNLASIVNMFKRVGVSAVVSGDPEKLRAATKLVLPGVGAFDPVMDKLRASGLMDELNRKVLDEGVPVLGMCVGMQMFGHGSEEGNLPGLGWLDATCQKFRQETPSLRVPHMGWNNVKRVKQSALTDTLPDDARFYFVHSFHMVCRDPSDVLLTTDYGGEFVAAVQRGNIFGTQFHPEKSHRFGMELYRRFASL